MEVDNNFLPEKNNVTMMPIAMIGICLSFRGTVLGRKKKKSDVSSQSPYLKSPQDQISILRLRFAGIVLILLGFYGVSYAKKKYSERAYVYYVVKYTI